MYSGNSGCITSAAGYGAIFSGMKERAPEDKMTTEERREKLKELNGAVTNTLGFLEVMQDPEPEKVPVAP